MIISDEPKKYRAVIEKVKVALAPLVEEMADNISFGGRFGQFRLFMEFDKTGKLVGVGGATLLGYKGEQKTMRGLLKEEFGVDIE